MMQAAADHWQLYLVLFGVIMSIASAAMMFYSFRLTSYDKDLSRVALDHSRQVLEREIERLHDQIYRDGGRIAELNHLIIDSIRSKRGDIDHNINSATGASFLSSMGVQVEDVKYDPDLVFVLTPLNSSQLSVFEAIKAGCEKIGLRAMRGDEKRIDGPILPYILRQIASARLIVANINNRNPNVFYELGIAQALGKPVIIVIKSKEDIPFDFKHQQIVIYEELSQLSDRFSHALSRFALSSAEV